MRAFVPAVSCPSCSYPNDNLFLFCQMCGYRRKTNSQNVRTSKISVDLQAIDNRLEQLKSASLQSAYSKQKCSLRTEFEKFLASLSNSKTILSASPTDTNRFLASKDRHGKTIVHSDGCSDSNLQSTARCKCPKRLVFKTVDTYTGKLRAIFKETGRCGEWNSMLGLDNPAASPEVQKISEGINRGTIASPHHAKAGSPPILAKIVASGPFFESENRHALN